MTRYLVIGGGIAGTTAAEEIRKLDSEGEITILEAEQHRLYSRVLLPHYLKEKTPRDRVFLKKPQWYEEKNIELMLGVRALQIDTKNQFVRTSEDRELPYDKLLITTGGELNLAPEDRRGVVYLRSIDDADLIVERVNELKDFPEDQRKGVVYGGGFIALEFINLFAKYDIKTTVVKRSGGFWSRILSTKSQNVLANHARSSGVTLVTNESSGELVGDAQLEGVKLSDGSIIEANIMGVGIGIHTDQSIFKDAGIDIASGVLANEYLETNVQGVYTAGDVAEFYDLTVGRQLRLGNWMNALMQGRAVGKSMAGERTKFELVSSYATNLLGKEIVFIGDTSRGDADEVIQRVANEEHATELFIRDGAVVGAVLIGDVKERQLITNAIKAKKMVE